MSIFKVLKLYHIISYLRMYYGCASELLHILMSLLGILFPLLLITNIPGNFFHQGSDQTIPSLQRSGPMRGSFLL